MQASLTNTIDDANSILRQIEEHIKRLETSGNRDTRASGRVISSAVQDARIKLDEAAAVARDNHALAALSPDTFNPFILYDIRRGVSRFAINEEERKLVVTKRIVDSNHEEELRSASERISNWIVVYTISDKIRDNSYVLNRGDSLETYKDDEADLRKTASRNVYLIANHALRRRLLAATEFLGEVDIDKVASLVEDALGKKEVKPEVTSRTWVCTSKRYTLDIVNIHALVNARRRMLEVPGVGDVKDLVEEDTLGRYLGLEGFDASM